jgi:hypothetical protein
MPDLWDAWTTASAGIAAALVAVLVLRHVLEAHLRPSLRRALDIVAVPLFALFAAYIASDFLLRPIP